MADARPGGGQGGSEEDGRGRGRQGAAVALRFFELFIGKPMFLLLICIIMLPGTRCPKRRRFPPSSSLPFFPNRFEEDRCIFCVLYLSLVQFRKQPSFLGGWVSGL